MLMFPEAAPFVARFSAPGTGLELLGQTPRICGYHCTLESAYEIAN
ncbi:hypothetical protein C4J93_2824 [Pseudomonas sp. R2-37-08W]|nr:hypothetical protein C4J93_2824 [Pseudomonas sp. R2-37-08W]AZF37604.1 hypothetical protein C4J88_2821 [Pseudomonas sp. R4-39-08]AZF42765.1 hypothetical protein C4J87_2606 [Pseudomonas sp. R1-43-08]AZF58491.1 hypothetical protein C4J84_2614 [Pseudomonas sp. R11-23-07]